MKRRDESIILDIKRLLKKRPTYGYKRITALLNKENGKKSGLLIYNKKRIYRIMRENSLLLPKSGKREGKG